MSSPGHGPSTRPPLIALVHRANRELQADMARHARAAGYEKAKLAHNSVFGTLPFSGARSADLAVWAGVTRQSMGEVIRDLVALGTVTMTTDPDDRRAKLVTYTEAGLKQVQEGMAHIADFDRRMIAELGEEGYECLRHGLDIIVEILKEDAPSD
jgi:DNA-binding MarR family transcriptional regulator